MSQRAKHFYEFGPFRLDTAEHLLLREGQSVPLMPKAFDTLLVLVQNSGHLLQKDELMKAVWPDAIVEEANLALNISILRKTMSESPDEHKYIETVPKRGYRFVAPVREVWEEGADLLLQEQTRSHVVVEEEEGQRMGVWAYGRMGENRVLPPPVAHAPTRLHTHLLPLIIIVLLVGLASALAYLWISRRSKETATSLPVKSIAVLPFKPLSADDSDDYLGLGMADTLIIKLSNTRQLIVRPTSAVRKYADPEQDPLAAGREQQVDAVLEGSIQRSGEKVRVTVRLLSVRDGSALWAYQCSEQQCTDLFAVQDSICGEVAHALMLKLTGEERARLTKRYTENTEAYQLYLKGRYFWNKRTDEGFKKAIEYLERAIKKDPNFALAYAGLAETYAAWGSLRPAERWPKTRAAAAKALDLDDTLAEPHASLALSYQRFDWDWSSAERAFKRAIELNPGYATAHQWYGLYLEDFGRFDEGIAELKRAQELDPLSLIISRGVAEVFCMARQYDKAIEECQKVLEIDPDFFPAHDLLGTVYCQKGMYNEAIAEFHKAINLSGPEDKRGLVALSWVYAQMGKRGEAMRLLDELKESSKQGYFSPYDVAVVYTALGEKDQAFEWLQQAYEERSGALTHLKVDPRFDSLRLDPRFQDLLRRVGLAP